MIMRMTIILIAFISLLSCKSNKIINTEGISKLTVIVDPLKVAGKAKEHCIIDKDSISQIVKKLNHAQKDLAKFRPTYRIEIEYLDNQKVIVLCNAKRINIGGITYKLDEDIEKVIY
jgi:hypothetical protein